MSVERMNELHVAHTCGQCRNVVSGICTIFLHGITKTNIECEHFRQRISMHDGRVPKISDTSA